MAKGTIKIWKGSFGFITDDAGGSDVFLHISEVPQGDRGLLKAGTVVNFEVQETPKGLAAHNVRLQGTGRSESSPGDTFHNPYTFVPTPPRPSCGFAGDFNPLECGLDHASLKPNLWTGHIPIKLTTVTPLVLLKGDGRKEDSTEEPYDVYDHIPESSLRGMLRSAYEVVTNSRYGCFSNSDRLAYRMAARKALELVPAIIKNGAGPGELVANLCVGTSYPTAEGPKKSKGNQQKGPMYAAMLNLYGSKKLQAECDTGYTPKTGDEVWAEIVLCQHDESPRRERRWFSQYQPWRNYLFWKVVKVWPKTKNGQPTKKPTQTGGTPWFSAKLPTDPKDRQSYYAPLNPKNPQRKVVKGRVLITNENMKGKHDERIFFVEGVNAKNPIQHDVTNLKEAWRMRIQSYREAHSDNDIFKRDGAIDQPWRNIGDDPGKTAWSPHQYQSDADKLKPGDLVYAHCEFDKGKIVGIADLFPVMISRELYANSPASLLDSSLKPARTRGKLSPADRLFGWTPQEGGDEAGYKSRIRVVCEDSTKSDTIIESFSGGALPLAILGQPKPAQGRFYVAKNEKGVPQDKGTSKEAAGYSGNKGLRGRKQYWHHKGLEANKAKAYWHPSAEDRTQEKYDGRYQEYRRPNENGKKNGKPKQDSQNRLINEWIKPGTVFKASLYVQNLQPEELGALLWLLTRNDEIGDEDEKHYFRLGYGKPLGFGSVNMDIDEERLVDGCLPLGTGKNWKETYYASLDNSPPATLNQKMQEECIKNFKCSMRKAYPCSDNYKVGAKHSFENLLFISGFLRALCGPKKDAPIHYPRLEHKPNPEGKNFEWFVDNDRYRNGKKLALPEVTLEEGLPYNPKT